MTSIIETIKAKVDVVEEIGLVVALQKSGKSFKGPCPFHNERTPSFYVFGESQTWRCFGCNEGGDVFTFVQMQQSLEFREALLYLAEKAGVAVEDYSSHNRSPEEERESQAAKERLRKLNEDALLWFHQMLLRSKDAAQARAYVQSRGISSESVVTFSLGYAPDRREGLSSYLLGQGYTESELVSGGLARMRDGGIGDSGGTGIGGGIYDYFRHRLIFPIRDTRGRVIGFGGRAFGDAQPKYLNSPQTLLFEKNSVLYAMDMARDASHQTGKAGGDRRRVCRCGHCAPVWDKANGSLHRQRYHGKAHSTTEKTDQTGDTRPGPRCSGSSRNRAWYSRSPKNL